MKISIITATYNSAATIGDTLQSVKEQTYPFVEHIIVDGLSTDSTLSIVQQYPHVAKCVSGKDGGIYDAMNKGIELASGEIVGILNSDDLYAHSRVLEKVAIAFADPAIQAVYADLEYVQAENINKIVRYWKSGSYKNSSFYWGWMPPHPTFFVRKQLYKQFGVFKISLRSAADYELMLRFLVKHKSPVAYIPEVTVKMRAGGVSNVSLKNRLRAHQEDKIAWKLNELKPYFFTLPLKPLRKIFQYIVRN